MSVHNNRDQPRVLCAEIVRVTWATDAGCRYEAMANLDNASTGGACLVIDDPIPVGTTVVIACHGAEFSSKVRHCTPDELGWLVGVEFAADARWDQELGALDHRVDPGRVGGMLRTHKQIKKRLDLRGTVSCIALWSALSRRTPPDR